MPHIQLFQWILILTCVVGTMPQSIVRGVVGQAVVLPCRYNVQKAGGATPMCWGRGGCPNSKCSEEILHTNGWSVVSRISSRYGLKADVANGDVSLTIENVNERDRGLYCCRIEIRGWFNDIKTTLNLQVERATTTVPTTTTTTTTAATTTTTTTTTQMVTTKTTTALFTTTKRTTVPFTTTNIHPAISFPFLTTNPPSPTTPNSTSGPTTATPSISTATGFPATTHPLVNIKSLPTTLLDQSTEHVGHFFTTGVASSATVEVSLSTADDTTGNEKPPLPFLSSGVLSSVIACILVLCGLFLMAVMLLVKRKKMRKYQLDKMKSLIKQEEEPEQTPVGTEGENGIFPL